MSKPKAAADKPETKSGKVSQPTPKAKRRVRQEGLQIDGFGLPVNAIARAVVLDRLELEDPQGTDGDWTEDMTAKAGTMTEKLYG